MEQENVQKLDIVLLRVSEPDKVPINSHIWVASSIFKRL